MDSEQSGSHLRFSIGLGAAAALVCFAYFLGFEHPWSLRGENLVDIYPSIVETWRLWGKGHFPVWTNGIWAGSALLANPQSGAFYPVYGAILSLTSSPHLRDFDLLTALHVGVLVSGTSWFLGRLGCRRWSAAFGAVLLFLSPRVLHTTLYLPSIAAVSYWPWMMGTAEKLLRSALTPNEEARSVLLVSLLIAVQCFTGYPQWAVYSASCACVWILFGRSSRTIASRLRVVALLGVATVMLSAVQLLPLVFEMADSKGRQVAESTVTVAVVPEPVGAFFDPIRSRADGHSLLTSPFLGIGTLALALSALLLRGRRSLLLAAIALVAGLASVGDALPVHDWIGMLPVYDRFRGALKFFLVAQIFLFWLSAVGLQALFDRVASKGRWMPVVVVIVALIAFAENASQFRIRLREVENTGFHREPGLPRDTRILEEIAPLLKDAKSPKGPPPRTFVAEFHTVLGGLAMLEGIETLRGGIPSLLSTRHHKILHRFKGPKGRQHGWLPRSTLDLLGVQRVLRMRPCQSPPWRDLEIVSPLERPTCVMRNPTGRPRYELIRNGVPVEDQQSMIDWMLNDVLPDGIPIVATALPPGASSLAANDGDLVEVLAYRPGRVSLETTSASDAMMLVRESWKSGWRAEIDGESVPVFPALGIYFAFPVAAGEHRVELRYRQPGLVPGLVLAGAWVAIAVFVFRSGPRMNTPK